MNRSSGGRGRALLVGTALTGAVTLAGCTPPAGQDPPGQHTTVAAPAPHAARTVEALVEGFRDTDKHSAHVTVKVSGRSGQLEHGSGAYRSTPSGLDLRMSLRITPQGATTGERAAPRAAQPDALRTPPATPPERAVAPARRVEMIVLGDSLYLRIHAKPAKPGKPWVELPVAEPASRPDPYSRLARITAQQVDPGAIMKRVLAAGTIDRATSEKLDGRTVTHYTVTVDTARAAHSIDDPQLRSAAVRRARKLPKTYSMELWLTPRHLPMKIVARHNTAHRDAAIVEVRYTMWEDAVSITAPPVDQVVAEPSG